MPGGPQVPPDQVGWHGQDGQVVPPASSRYRAPGRASDGSAVLEHEGRLVMRGRRPGRLSLELAAYCVVGTILAALIRDIPPVVAVLIGLSTWGIGTVAIVLHGRGRVRITTDQVHIRTRGRTRTIPRHAIAQVVYVRHLVVIGAQGYIALLDAAGKPLWRHPSQYWSPETIQALLGAGGQPVTVETLTPGQAQTYWPHLLTWQLRNPGKAVLAGAGGVVIAVALVVVIAIVVTS